MVFIRKILQFYEIKSPILRIFKVTASKDDNTNQTDYFYRFDQILATEIHEEKTVDEGGLSVEYHSADAAAVHHEAETLDLEEELAAAVHRLESFLVGKGHHHHQWEHWEENTTTTRGSAGSRINIRLLRWSTIKVQGIVIGRRGNSWNQRSRNRSTQS